MKSLHNNELDSSVIDWPVHMQRAVDLAANVMTATPNPRVGCVIIRDREVIAEGWHQAAGQAHAEVMALQAAQDCSGGTAFVTLEPCNHQGKTGPCTEALIDAGIQCVVIAMVDPNPKVAGKGVARLEAAGIEVFHLLDFEAATQELNRGFVQRWQTGRPRVRMKLAMSLDGRTALANGESKWITAASAREDVQRLRAISSAIVTGIGTIEADDPQLNVRAEELGLSETQLISNQACLDRQPMRVVLDSDLRVAANARVFDGPGEAVVYTSKPCSAADKDRLNHVEIRQQNEGQSVDLLSMLESLAADYECTDVLVEAGPTLCGAFLQAGLVDELVVYIAPRIFGADARPLLQVQGIDSLASTYDFAISSVDKVGSDIKVVLSSIS